MYSNLEIEKNNTVRITLADSTTGVNYIYAKKFGYAKKEFDNFLNKINAENITKDAILEISNITELTKEQFTFMFKNRYMMPVLTATSISPEAIVFDLPSSTFNTQLIIKTDTKQKQELLKDVKLGHLYKINLSLWS